MVYDDFDPLEDNLNYDKIIVDFKDLIAKLEIEVGSVLVNKEAFRIWFDESNLMHIDFEPENLFTVIEIIADEEETRLRCLNHNKIIDIDALLFFLNWGNFQSFSALFNFYFEKVI